MPIFDTLATLARGPRCRCLRFVVATWLMTQGIAQAETPVVPQLEVEGDGAAGHTRVSWSADADATAYELQRASAADFSDGKTYYEGEHTASVLSGLLDGTLYFRVRSHYADRAPGPWSEVKSFEVKHHERAVAFAFFFAGALIFAATVGFLWIFSRRVPTDD